MPLSRGPAQRGNTMRRAASDPCRWIVERSGDTIGCALVRERMMDTSNQRNEDIPSQRIALLQRMKSLRIIRLLRYSWDPVDYVVNELQVPAAAVFRYTLGPLVIVLDNGVQVGFNSIPAQASVVVWLEDSPDLPTERDGRLAGDPEFYPIDVTDPVYGDVNISTVLGNAIEAIALLVRAPKNALLADLPREAGVVITLANGAELVAAHGLHNDSDDFSVIMAADIREDVRAQLAVLEV